jgi:hypothetical protein
MMHVSFAIFNGLRVFPLLCVLLTSGSHGRSVVPWGAVWLARQLVVLQWLGLIFKTNYLFRPVTLLLHQPGSLLCTMFGAVCGTSSRPKADITSIFILLKLENKELVNTQNTNKQTNTHTHTHTHTQTRARTFEKYSLRTLKRVFVLTIKLAELLLRIQEVLAQRDHLFLVVSHHFFSVPTDKLQENVSQ